MYKKDILCVAIALLTMLLLTACQVQSPACKVIRVIDGDSIVLEGNRHVRYIGIDAPEKDEFGYLEATQANRELVEGKKVTLEKDISERDKFGRLLRYVYVDNIFVNAEMIRLGFAQASLYPPDIKHQPYLKAMEVEAKQLRKGIWK
jgi:micrococcal nuclease